MRDHEDHRRGVTSDYIVPDIAAHLRISNAATNQVLDAAMGYICPEIHIGAKTTPGPTTDKEVALTLSWIGAAPCVLAANRRLGPR